MERRWKFGYDLSIDDSILDSVTFRDIILAVHHNCQNISPEAIKGEAKAILDQRVEDMWYLVMNNIDEIAVEAMKGRG